MRVKYIHGYYPEETLEVFDIELIEDRDYPYFILHCEEDKQCYATCLEGPDTDGVLVAYCPENF